MVRPQREERAVGSGGDKSLDAFVRSPRDGAKGFNTKLNSVRKKINARQKNSNPPPQEDGSTFPRAARLDEAPPSGHQQQGRVKLRPIGPRSWPRILISGARRPSPRVWRPCPRGGWAENALGRGPIRTGEQDVHAGPCFAAAMPPGPSHRGDVRAATMSVRRFISARADLGGLRRRCSARIARGWVVSQHVPPMTLVLLRPVETPRAGCACPAILPPFRDGVPEIFF